MCWLSDYVMMSGSNVTFFSKRKWDGGRGCDPRNGAIVVLRKSSDLTFVLRDNGVKICNFIFR